MQREFIFTDKWLDLLFEDRNRSYGAYVLRKRQPDNVIIGLLLSVFFIGSVMFTAYWLNRAAIETITTDIIEKKDKKDIIYTVTLPETPAVATPKKINSEAPKSSPNKNYIPVIINDDLKKDVDDNKDDLKKDDTNNDNGTGNQDDLDVHDDGSKTKGDDNDLNNNSDTPKPIVEIMPQFPGGESALLSYLGKNTKYPKRLIDEGISGTVWVTFVIGKDGKVNSIKIERGIEGYPEFADAAINSVSKMPAWTPGKQNGMNVPVLFTVPVKFSLKRDF